MAGFGSEQPLTGVFPFDGDDDIIEMEDLKEKNMEILQRLGGGATPAFAENLQ